MVCNSGVSLIPDINGEMHHFVNSGLYDALFIMEDEETKTLWNHVTGEALYGKLAGYRLPVTNLMQMNVAQALELDPGMQVAISDRPYRGAANMMPPAYSPDNGDPQMMDMFTRTLGKEDQRRPRMDMGLGVWSEKHRRYYPVHTLRANGNPVIDEFDGKTLLVYLDPETFILSAIYVESRAARREGQDILLDNGLRVRSGRLVDADDRSLPVERPQQIFTRWYGFSLTFPNPEIYE